MKKLVFLLCIVLSGCANFGEFANSIANDPDIVRGLYNMNGQSDYGQKEYNRMVTEQYNAQAREFNKLKIEQLKRSLNP